MAWLPDKSHVPCPRHRSCSRPICRPSVDCMLFHCTSLRTFPWKPSAHPLSAAQHYLVHLHSNIVYLCTCYERESSCFIPCFYSEPTFGNGIMIKLELYTLFSLRCQPHCLRRIYIYMHHHQDEEFVISSIF